MNLIEIKTNENQEPVVSGRELHEKLEIKTPYTQWIDRMLEYGFVENLDFTLHSQKCESSNISGVKVLQSHNLSLDMAKEICMIQRNEKGKKIRQYFIQIEKEYNSPEKIMARGLVIANKEIKTLNIEIEQLTLDNKIKEQQIQELKPKATYYDIVLQCDELLPISIIAKDYGMSATYLNDKLHELGIQYKLGGVWLLYSKYQSNGYTGTKTNNYIDSYGTTRSKTHTYWTQKGRLFLYEELKKEGILPLLERESEKEEIKNEFN